MPYSSFELLDHTRSILVFGRDGQVGKALQICLKDLKAPVVFLGRSDCDLSSESSITEVLNRYQPQVVINAAAYTAVDEAERCPELAFAINARAPELMAQYITQVKYGQMIHYSADYVFGDTKDAPYIETDTPGPLNQLNAYGKSKLSGELAIKSAFTSFKRVNHSFGDLETPRYLILRTSWAYGDGDNFIRKILHSAANQDKLSVVNDQVGVATDASWLAQITVQLAFFQTLSGIYHIVPDGETSWYNLARFCIEVARSNGLNLTLQEENLKAISSLDYRANAKRPHNSRMSNQKLKTTLAVSESNATIPHWESQVQSYVKHYVQCNMLENQY